VGTKYFRTNDDQGMKIMRAGMSEEVKAAEQEAWHATESPLLGGRP